MRVTALLGFSRLIDRFSERVGYLANWLVLFACLISAGNAVSRYTFNASSNAWLEIQWYMFGALIMLGAAYTLRRNGHVRVDLLYGNLSPRKQLWIDLLGGILFLLPTTIIIGLMAWPLFWTSFVSGEMSSNAGGLVRWPIKLFVPLGFLLIFIQGLSEIIKRVAALRGDIEFAETYDRPVQ